MKIELGKYYITGTGEKRGPMGISGGIHFPFRCPVSKNVYTATGEFYRDVDSAFDLVDEWKPNIPVSDHVKDAAQAKAKGQGQDGQQSKPKDYPDFAGGDMQSKPKATLSDFVGLLLSRPSEAISLMGADRAKVGSDRTGWNIMDGGKVRRVTFADISEPGYEGLADVLQRAHNQAATGKGKERHANGKDFDDQPIIAIPALLGSIEGHTYQIMKKAQEANTMAKRGDNNAAKAELLGVINYAAAAVLSLED